MNKNTILEFVVNKYFSNLELSDLESTFVKMSGDKTFIEN